MKNIIIIFCLIVLYCNIYGQGIKIYNESGSKVFKENSIFEIFTDKEDIGECDCSNFIEFQGKITAIEKDSIQMNVSMFRSNQVTEKSSISQTQVSKDQELRMAIAKTDIRLLRNYKDLNKAKNPNAKSGLGVLLISTGIITGLNTFLVSKGKNRHRLWISSGLQITLGAIFIKLGHNKKYNFKSRDNPWKFD